MSSSEKIFQGLPVSPGIAIGRVLQLAGRESDFVIPEDIDVAPDQVDDELAAFEQARERTRQEIRDLQQEVCDKLNPAEAGIFDAHLLIVDDESLMKDVGAMIRDRRKKADYAVYHTVERYARTLEAIKDDYLKERAQDVRDVGFRLLGNLRDEHIDLLENLSDRRIILAHDLSPSETAVLNRDRVLGFAVESGSSTSHTAILARSLQLPAVVGMPHELMQLNADAKIILDGYTGKIIVHPDHRTEEAYRLKAEEAGRLISDLLREKQLQPETPDGFLVQLAANIEKIEDARQVAEFGGYGIGLFRTEFLFMNADQLPEEEEQFEIYKKLLLTMDNRPVIIRTLDIGGDKFSQSMYRTTEQNPFLGLRGIRLCLRERQDIFRTQLRALLRAGVFGNMKLMLPMLSCPDEVQEVRRLIAELQQELAAEKLDFVHTPCIGAMIETPAAALQAEQFAPLVDFLSLGTNDLVQYTMAIDRSNEKVAYLYQPTHPAILNLIANCVQAARRHNIWVSVCGQMASDPRYVPLLVGLGVHELSMELSSLGLVRRVIRSIRMHEAEELAAEALEAASAAEVLAMSMELLRRVAPEVADISVQQQ